MDITLCMNNEKCDLRDTCLRAQASETNKEKLSPRQSYMDFLK
ncbi:MAG: hypothetical protein ACRCX2_29200 [Paraclostridium sp.]